MGLAESFLVIYCSIGSTINLVTWNNNKHLWFHIIYVGQEFGSGLAGWFWLWISHEVAVKMLPGDFIISRPDWGWRIYFPEGLSHAGRLGLAAGWRPQSLATEALHGMLESTRFTAWGSLSPGWMVRGWEWRGNLRVLGPGGGRHGLSPFCCILSPHGGFQICPQVLCNPPLQRTETTSPPLGYGLDSLLWSTVVTTSAKWKPLVSKDLGPAARAAGDALLSRYDTRAVRLPASADVNSSV